MWISSVVSTLFPFNLWLLKQHGLPNTCKTCSIKARLDDFSALCFRCSCLPGSMLVFSSSIVDVLIPAVYEDFSSWNLGLSFLLVSLLRENSSFTVVSVLLFSTQYNRTLFLTLIHHFHWIVLYREKPSLRDWLASAYSLAWLLFSCL